MSWIRKNWMVAGLMASLIAVGSLLAANTLNEHVGPTFSAVGSTPAFDQRIDEHGSLVVQQVSGKYAETTKRGNVYCAYATALTPTTAISGTTSAPLTLYNPANSSRRYKILKVGAAQCATGTLGSGASFHCGYTLNGPTATQTNTIPTGTVVTPLCMDMGNANASTATVLSTATLHAAASACSLFQSQGESVGGTTTSTPGLSFEDLDGIMTLEPGSGWTLGTVSAAGSSPLISITIVWEEEGLAQ